MTVASGILTIEKVFDDTVSPRLYVYSLVNTPLPPVNFSCAITSPAPSAVVTQGIPVTISGTLTAAGTVVVKLGSTTLGAATVSGLGWTYLWTPQPGDVGAQTLNATATATVGGATADAPGIAITVATAITCAITSPTAGAVLAQGTPFTITGTVNVAGTVNVYEGVTLLGAATMSSLTWSYSWTPQVGDIGAQTLNATATATVGGSTGNAPGVAISVGSASSTFTGKQLASLSASNNFSASAVSTHPAVQQNNTIAILFWWAPGTTPAAGTYALWGAFNAGTLAGWYIGFKATPSFTMEFFPLNGATAQNVAIGQPVMGLNCIVLTRDSSNNIRSSLNGGAVVVTALTITPLDPPSAATHSIGGLLGANFGWTTGGALECARLSRLATDIELAAWSNVIYPTTPTSRYALPAALTGDAACTFDWRGSRDWDGSAGTSTSLGSVPVTFTKNGAPTLVAMSEQYTAALTFQDAGSPSFVAGGGGNYWKTDPYARLVNTNLGTAQGGQIAVAYYNNDTTTAENGSERVPIYLNGTWNADAPPVPDHTANITLKWVQLAAYNAAVPSGTVEFWAPAQFDATANGGTVFGGYIAGIITGASPTFDASTKAARILCMGDSLVAGATANTGGNEWVAKIRADFPTSGTGGLTTDAYGGRQLYYTVGGIGAPNAAAEAAIIVSKLHVATGGPMYLVLWFGFNDNAHPQWTAAQFGAGYQALINAVKAIDSSIQIFVMNLPQTGTSGIPAMNTQIAALTNCTIINTTGLGLTYTDGTHPDIASQATIKTAVKTALAY